MANRGRKIRDWSSHFKGIPEIAVDPYIIAQLHAQKEEMSKLSKDRQEKSVAIYNFIIKIAMKILPPKQRKVFYSVWVRNGGRMNKGVMEYSRQIKQSHRTNYNNYYKAIIRIQAYLNKTGYEDFVLEYLFQDPENTDEGMLGQ